MGRIADFLRQGWLVGLVAAALLLPGTGSAQTSTTTTTTVTPSSSSTTTTTSTMNTTVIAYQSQPVDLYNMYNGYTSMYDLENGAIVGFDAYGNPVKADFLHNGGNRVLVRLTPDDNWGTGLDVERGFSRGVTDFPISNFDPRFLDIGTGTTVSFYADVNHHDLEPVDCPGMNEDVPLVPGRVYNFTFNQPGNYRINDGFGGGPTYNESGGLMIRVRGENLGLNGTLPPSATAYFTQLGLIQTTTVGTSSGITTSTSTTQTATPPVQEEQSTTTTTTAPAPTETTTVQKTVVHKKVIRNTEIK
jgi:hypothetical protein